MSQLTKTYIDRYFARQKAFDESLHPRDPEGRWVAKALVEALKYSPDQPRDPAGTSTGGQWSSFGAARQERLGRNERVEPRTSIVADRPMLIFGSPVTGETGLSVQEREIITKIITEFGNKLPASVGQSVYVSIYGRRPPAGETALAIGNPASIYINRHPGAFDDTDRLARTLAHEFGHVIRGNDFSLAQRFEQTFGLGPYKRGTAGVDSLYHLQNSSELFSKLYERHLMGDSVPSEFVALLGGK